MRDPNNMEVYWIDINGSVLGRSWISGNWQDKYVAGPTTPPGKRYMQLS
ncbi:MAG TPA: hypothetical protein VH796_15260 [Nitrososphaeraceae archaeon]